MGQESASEDVNDSLDNEQSDLSPWESPDRDNTSATSASEPVDASESGSETISGVDWTRREVGDHYPVDELYHCNACNGFAANTLQGLKTHVDEHDDIDWGEYLKTTGLHRCAGCGDGLATLTTVYCDDCTKRSSDRISCRNCGSVRVKVDDPFCSPDCAGERMTAAGGGPLSEPNDPDEKWLNHPHRLPTGIPAGAPFIENHTFACRECYEYGSDDLHEFAVHVSEKHDFGWDGYIEKYELRRCRVCDEPLDSLLPLYCSDRCQRSDPDPVKTCKREECSAAVERRQDFCSRDCYIESRSK